MNQTKVHQIYDGPMNQTNMPPTKYIPMNQNKSTNQTMGLN